jgi:ribosomal protein S12 methylthiotransferase accessory factor
MMMSETFPLSPPDLAGLVDPQVGLLSRISLAEMEPSDASVFIASAKLADLTAYGLPPGSGGYGGAGAGLTREEAFMAAAGEAAERYGLAQLPPDLIRATAGELKQKGIPITSPEDWALFDDSQYGTVRFARFTDSTPIAWLPAHELTSDRLSYVPACLVHMPWHCHFADEQVIGYATSTGAACACSPEGAALKGIMEVVERDAFIIIWRNRLPCPQILIDEESSLYELVKERFWRRGLRYSLFLTSLDLPFHSVFGVLQDDSGAGGRLTVGGACHFNPCEAVRKTMLELVQGMRWLEFMGAKEFPVVPDFTNVRHFEDRIRMYGSNDLLQAFGFLLDNRDRIPLSDLQAVSLSTNDGEALRTVCSSFRERNLAVYARNVTPCDIRSAGLSVVKVLVPQAQQIEGDVRLAFLGGTRWREIPVKLGRIPRPVEQINPFPHPYP